jgi:Protein of unknown function (DUF2950)
MTMKYRWLIRTCLLACALSLADGCSNSGPTPVAQPPKESAPATAQTSFATPEEAVSALVADVEKHDVPALQRLLGPGTESLLSSGDPVQDKNESEAFLARYRVHHELVAGSADELVLLVGEDLWPLPMPIVRRDQRWRFDGAAGADELVLRRIGANELHAIDVMQGAVAAQSDYAAAAHDGQPAGMYAQKLRSSPGKQDGLYWDVAPGQAQSPAGPLLAAASADGYADAGTRGGQAPYHGYFYRMLTGQGSAAPGGAENYLRDGKLTGGFAVLAYPATYGASGIMTFIVNQDGVVWQRDLGPQTAEAAASIKEFNPDDSWTPIEPEG